MNPPPANGKAIIGIPRVIKDSSGVLLIFVLSLCTYFYLKEAAKAIHPFGKAALEAGKAEGNAAGNLEAEDAYKGKYISISMKFAHAELLSISLIAVSAITLIYQSGKSFRAIARYRPEEPEGKK